MTDGERLKIIYSALRERGYAPVNQIVGFILSGDPTYITNHNGARSLAGRINRNELLSEIVTAYMEQFADSPGKNRGRDPIKDLCPGSFHFAGNSISSGVRRSSSSRQPATNGSRRAYCVRSMR